MIFIYGVRVFTKFQGYFGERVTCPNCNKSYSPAYVRLRMWAHFDYIPVFPVKTRYCRMCPVCGSYQELKPKDAKPLMINKNETQNIEVYARHILNNINTPQGNNNYELWFKDNLTSEEFCVFNNLNKSQIKDIKKNRGLKTLNIIDVN